MSCQVQNINLLTKREMQVAALIYDGYQDSEVAMMLGIETYTASNHRKNILKKIDGHSVKDIVRWYGDNIVHVKPDPIICKIHNSLFWKKFKIENKETPFHKLDRIGWEWINDTIELYCGKEAIRCPLIKPPQHIDEDKMGHSLSGGLISDDSKYKATLNKMVDRRLKIMLLYLPVSFLLSLGFRLVDAPGASPLWVHFFNFTGFLPLMAFAYHRFRVEKKGFMGLLEFFKISFSNWAMKFAYAYYSVSTILFAI